MSGHQQTAATARPAGDNDPLPILNLNEIDIYFVSNQIKENTWNGQFVDLVQSQLQKQQVQFRIATYQFTIKPQF